MQQLPPGARGNSGCGARRVPSPARRTTARAGFTLVELLVSALVLAIIILLVGELFSSAALVTGIKKKHMDADAQARAVFDRMAIDFGQMVRRPDVDYFLKDALNPQKGSGGGGNDQLAFFSQVPGYTQAAGTRRTVSVVGYRINANSANPFYLKLQRYGNGLLWSGSSALVTFSSTPATSGSGAIVVNWPAATDASTDDGRYELAGAQVFRMEYFYVLKGQTLADGTLLPPLLSDIPWDTRNPGPNHTAVNGLSDVAAIAVVIAVIDPRSRVLVTDAQLTALAKELPDFSTTGSDGSAAKPGDLEAQWKQAIEKSASGISRTAASTIRVYQRRFYLPASFTSTP